MGRHVDWDQDTFPLTNDERWVVGEVLHACSGGVSERRAYLRHKAAKNGLTVAQTERLLEIFELDEAKVT